MVITKIKVDGKRVRLGGYGFQKYQMLQLGQFAVATVKARVARGIGSSDSPMPPLKARKRQRFSKSQNRYVEYGGLTGWPRAKQVKGLRPIRDLMGTGEQGGHMLDAFRVTYADASKARIDVSTRWGRIKARANERKAPWFGFSRNDEAAIYDMAQTMFKGNIANFGVKLRGVGLPRNPIWMNPDGIAGLSRFGSN